MLMSRCLLKTIMTKYHKSHKMSKPPSTEEWKNEDAVLHNELPGKQSLLSKLATWKMENHIEFSVCDQLLTILNPYTTRSFLCQLELL